MWTAATAGPVYPGGFLSAFATVADRDRREQIQDKANFAAQFSLGNWFIRPTAALLYCDWMTEKLNPELATTPTGYQNYADRYDVNGGADAGYKITSSLAVTLGYRYGHQQQEQFTFSRDSSPNDYQRVLFGLEGRPWKWLNVKIQGGPDFRNYEGDSATHITPVNDLNPVKYYGEALLTAKFTAADSLIFKYKQWQWLSTLGKVPVFRQHFRLELSPETDEQTGSGFGRRLLSVGFYQRKSVHLRAERFAIHRVSSDSATPSTPISASTPLTPMIGAATTKTASPIRKTASSTASLFRSERSQILSDTEIQFFAAAFFRNFAFFAGLSGRASPQRPSRS